MNGEKKRIRILFIGNSHTFYNDLPALVRERAEEDGVEAEVVMIARGGWYLSQHVKEPETFFNVRCGGYDYAVLQEHSHPFDRIGEYRTAAKTLCGWIREAGGVPVIYATWAEKANEGAQELMNRVNGEIARENGALLAAVGASWWDRARKNPEKDLYGPDGAHASPEGSRFASEIIWRAIRKDLEPGITD
ncbi:MAG: SGNH/GDSL hydrolase family protein [Clostridia bacterium]|nr:SGNH/GDSL hydrolase family protein [Clostridia bacterium]